MIPFMFKRKHLKQHVEVLLIGVITRSDLMILSPVSSLHRQSPDIREEDLLMGTCAIGTL